MKPMCELIQIHPSGLRVVWDKYQWEADQAPRKVYYDNNANTLACAAGDCEVVDIAKGDG